MTRIPILRRQAPRTPLRERAAALFLLALLQAACGRPEHTGDRLHAVPGGDAERGARLLGHYQCGSCHAIPDIPAASGRSGPPLDGFGARSYIAGQVPNTPALLVRWIEDPQALVPGARMPDMGVPEADARDMAAYLMGLRP